MPVVLEDPRALVVRRAESGEPHGKRCPSDRREAASDRAAQAGEVRGAHRFGHDALKDRIGALLHDRREHRTAAFAEVGLAVDLAHQHIHRDAQSRTQHRRCASGPPNRYAE